MADSVDADGQEAGSGDLLELRAMDGLVGAEPVEEEDGRPRGGAVRRFDDEERRFRHRADQRNEVARKTKRPRLPGASRMLREGSD